MMTEKFIGPDAKIEMMSDEELDMVAGGAATTYFSQPYAGRDGSMVVSTVTVSGKMKYDPSQGSFSGFLAEGGGSCSSLTVPLDKFDAYKDRIIKRGNTVVGLGIAGSLL